MSDKQESMVERRIREAQARGELEHLPGAGQPLALDDDALVAPELRAAYRLLKNAGYVPEDVQLRREIADLERIAMQCEGARGADRAAALKRISLLRARLGGRGMERSLALDGEYREKLLDKLSGDS